jgi:hypothetical protein
MFALDALGEGGGLWRTLLTLTLHLIPSLVLVFALILAWRWEWIGAVLFAAAGTLYVTWSLERPIPSAIKLNWIVTVTGPAFVASVLFLENWLKRYEIRGRNS